MTVIDAGLVAITSRPGQINHERKVKTEREDDIQFTLSGLSEEGETAQNTSARLFKEQLGLYPMDLVENFNSRVNFLLTLIKLGETTFQDGTKRLFLAIEVNNDFLRTAKLSPSTGGFRYSLADEIPETGTALDPVSGKYILDTAGPKAMLRAFEIISARDGSSSTK